MTRTTEASATLAILGAGPIGVEAALYALNKGFRVDLYEAHTPGASVHRWTHVGLFSPWSMNRSPWGERALRAAGHALAPEDDFPSARDYLDDYLLPLAATPALADALHEGCRVVGVARRDVLKGDLIGDASRADGPFVLLLEDADGQRYAEADIVLDTTGVHDQPLHLGPGGLPAIGEDAADALIERHIPDVLGADRADYADKTTLLVGAGYSAVTTANLLVQLRADAAQTRVVWLTLPDHPPHAPMADDPLPQRLALAKFGARALRGEITGVEPLVGQLRALRRHAGRLQADIADIGHVDVDRVVANVGYRPDASLYRELQVHQCYASEGPMKLAAYLLSQRGGSGDCLQQSGGGFDTLVSPEPDFYILGSKSYGRNSDFLLKLGFEQIEQLFAHIAH